MCEYKKANKQHMLRLELFQRPSASCETHLVWNMETPLLLSSECVQTLQPPITEESMRLVGRGLVASSSSSWCAEIGQHGPVVLSLCCFFSVFLIVVPEKRENGTGSSFQPPPFFFCIHFLQSKDLHCSLNVKGNSKWMWFSYINSRKFQSSNPCQLLSG